MPSRSATYIVGDIHGCWGTLRALLNQIPFDSERDRLWLTGDLVNRGPDNLQVLRWARERSETLGPRFACVLGNHDLHLLRRAADLAPAKPRDTVEDVLDAEDRDELLAWLRGQPLLHRATLGDDDPETPSLPGPVGLPRYVSLGELVLPEVRREDVLLVHAGLLPAWTPDEIETLAAETSEALTGPDGDALLATYDDPPARWSEDLSDSDRRALALSTLTRLRTLRPDGTQCSSFSGPPELAPTGCIPWFDHPERRSADATILHGHWAALGLRIDRGLRSLDTACVWGKLLTALRLEDGRVYQEVCRDDTAVG